jgi:hypothetical protein
LWGQGSYFLQHAIIDTGFSDSLRHLYGALATASASKRTLVLPDLQFLEFDYSRFAPILAPEDTADTVAGGTKYKSLHDKCFYTKKDDQKRRTVPFGLVFDEAALAIPHIGMESWFAETHGTVDECVVPNEPDPQRESFGKWSQHCNGASSSAGYRAARYGHNLTITKLSCITPAGKVIWQVKSIVRLAFYLLY